MCKNVEIATVAAFPRNDGNVSSFDMLRMNGFYPPTFNPPPRWGEERKRAQGAWVIL